MGVLRAPVCYSSGEALLPWHETARRLFIGSFTLRDTLLDRERCATMIGRDRGDDLDSACGANPAPVDSDPPV